VPSDATNKLERMAVTFASKGKVFTKADGVEFGRTLADLAAKLDRATDLLHQLVELVHPQEPGLQFELTRRELEILNHLANGLSNAEIASKCWISENTVKFHLKNLFRKLTVRDRGQAMMIARDVVRRLDYPRDSV
jgi:two-component system, NarL family, response regulator LiaR